MACLVDRDTQYVSLAPAGADFEATGTDGLPLAAWPTPFVFHSRRWFDSRMPAIY